MKDALILNVTFEQYRALRLFVRRAKVRIGSASLDYFYEEWVAELRRHFVNDIPDEIQDKTVFVVVRKDSIKDAVQNAEKAKAEMMGYRLVVVTGEEEIPANQWYSVRNISKAAREVHAITEEVDKFAYLEGEVGRAVEDPEPRMEDAAEF